MKGHSKNAIANGNGWLPFWFGGKFNKRLIQKRTRQRRKNEQRFTKA